MLELAEAVLRRIVEGQYNLVLFTLLLLFIGYALGRYVRGNGFQKIVKAQAAQIDGLIKELAARSRELEKLRRHSDVDAD